MSDAARRIGEELRRTGHTEPAEISDLVGKVDTRPRPEAGSPEPPPGIPGDPSDATRAANEARAQAETDAHFRGLSDKQIGEEMDAQIHEAIRARRIL